MLCCCPAGSAARWGAMCSPSLVCCWHSGGNVDFRTAMSLFSSTHSSFRVFKVMLCVRWVLPFPLIGLAFFLLHFFFSSVSSASLCEHVPHRLTVTLQPDSKLLTLPWVWAASLSWHAHPSIAPGENRSRKRGQGRKKKNMHLQQALQMSPVI